MLIVPAAMFSSFGLGTILPATYAANGYYTLINGGENISNISNYMSVLLLISAVAILAFIKIIAQKDKVAVTEEYLAN